MKTSNIVFILFGVPLLILLLITIRQVIEIAATTKGISYTQLPYARSLPGAELKILFLGDSTAVGTGAANNRLSTAGYFASDFPLAEIINISRNGKRIHELLEEFDTQTFGKYDLVVIQIGGNDILKFTPFQNIEIDLAAVIDRAKTVGRHVVVLHSGNVGTAPIFHWPFDRIMTERTRKVREIYIGQAKAHGAVYVDLFSERNEDFFLKDIKRYYSPDYLHPSGDGYRWWYQRIRQTLDQSGVVLKQNYKVQNGI
jgi:lysophospholipase L1-like esterase